jgi:hypothetical protein
MSGPATCPNTPNKETSNAAQAGTESTSTPIWNTNMSFGFKQGKNWGKGPEECIIIKQSRSQVWSSGQRCGPVAHYFKNSWVGSCNILVIAAWQGGNFKVFVV